MRQTLKKPLHPLNNPLLRTGFYLVPPLTTQPNKILLAGKQIIQFIAQTNSTKSTCLDGLLLVVILKLLLQLRNKFQLQIISELGGNRYEKSIYPFTWDCFLNKFVFVVVFCLFKSLKLYSMGDEELPTGFNRKVCFRNGKFEYNV